MENEKDIELLRVAYCEMQIDVINGKNLELHFKFIFKELTKLSIIIAKAKLNNEETTNREDLRNELFKLGNEIIKQLTEKLLLR
jgi:hypothetical protein